MFGSCKKDTNGDNNADAFDRKVMLTNVGNNLIVPAYNNFQQAVIQYDSSVTDFCQNPDASKLLTLQQKFKLAYIAWEYCCSFEFGPAEQLYLSKSVNTFPTDVTQINSNIQAGSYDLNAVMNLDAKGLPAFDYLLFGVGADNSAILIKYTSDGDAGKRKQYLMDLSADTKNKIGAVVAQWKDGYLDAFINNTGTDIGSSTSYLYNEFLKSYEGLKNYKFSLPLGRMAGQTTTSPEKVEAYYSGISGELAKHHWNSTKYIWEGRDLNGVDGAGFQEYLASVEGGGTLITQTLQQQANIEATFAALPGGKLSDIIIQQFDKADAINTELQKLTRFYKSDFSSLLGIAITFNSGDGD
ncbi:MAG: imelysin family protein [Bacteroidota bacterium]